MEKTSDPVQPVQVLGAQIIEGHAIGLAVAIPAVIAYNAFTRQNRVINSRFDSFAHDLHDFFATGSRVGEAMPAGAKR